jgi:hypothetical protein
MKSGSIGRKGNLTGGAIKTPPVKEKTLEEYGIDKGLAKQAREPHVGGRKSNSAREF